MPYATINGAELFYEESGSQDGESSPIIFHHGYTSSHDCWHGVVPRLSGQYHCVVMDGRGAGDSNNAPGPCTLDQYAADVVGLADHLGFGFFNYVGLSMGGAVGYELALRYPERLSCMVLVAPAPADGIQIPSAVRERSVSLWRNKDEATLFREWAITSGRPDFDYLRRGIKRQLSCSEAHYFDAWESMVKLRVGERLGEIKTETLMVAAAADGLLASNLRDFQRLGNATLHVFSRVGHGIPYEVPSALSRVIRDFLEHGVVTARTKQEDLAKIRVDGVAVSR